MKHWLASAVAMLLSCSATAADLPPLQTVPQVDLQRYAGDWYVIANIPPSIEKNAYNSVEHYEVDADGNIPTRFTYRKNGFDGSIKTLESKGFVVDKDSNAEWGVQFFWPIKAEYLIVYLADDYSRAIVARNKRDYVWLLSRTPTIPDQEYEAFTQRIAALGYDIAKLNKVPQRWPDPGHPHKPQP